MSSRGEFDVIEKGKQRTPETATKFPDIVVDTATTSPPPPPLSRDRKKQNLISATLTTVPQPPAPSTTQVSFEEASTRAPRQRHASFRNEVIDKYQNRAQVTKSESNETSVKEEQILPQLISNDKKRSTSYRRFVKSSDFEKVKASPLATRFVYNWKPLERLPTRVVQAKVKVYKPPKRIEMTGRPSSPYRLCVDYETKDSHAHNHERVMDMKRLQYLREHTEWSIYPYAGVEEREQYKWVFSSNIRLDFENFVRKKNQESF